jgi:DNA-binding MarR family transcriptional regulator
LSTFGKVNRIVKMTSIARADGVAGAVGVRGEDSGPEGADVAGREGAGRGAVGREGAGRERGAVGREGAEREDVGHEGAEPGAVEEIWSLLRMLFGQHRRRFLIAASELDLHPAQAGALMQLSSPLPMSELAGLLGCDSSNVTGLVDRLEARKLVARQPSVEDRRVKNVVLTEDGEALRERMLAALAEAPGGFEQLGPDKQHQLRDLLRQALGGDAPSR